MFVTRSINDTVYFGNNCIIRRVGIEKNYLADEMKGMKIIVQFSKMTKDVNITV